MYRILKSQHFIFRLVISTFSHPCIMIMWFFTQRLQRAIARKTEELDKLRLNKSTSDAQTDELLEEKDAIIKVGHLFCTEMKAYIPLTLV